MIILCAFLNRTDIQKHHEHHEQISHTTFSPNHTEQDHNEHMHTHVNTLKDILIINADPVVSILISFFYIYYFGTILKSCCLMLSQAVPSFIDFKKVKCDLANLVNIF